MDLQTAIQKKVKLETLIANKILDFELETGLEVSKIKIRTWNAKSLCSTNLGRSIKLKIEASIPTESVADKKYDVITSGGSSEE